MSPASLDWASFAAILAMGLAAYATRVSGFWMMSHVPVTPRVQRMLDALPGSIVVAIVAPMVWRSGLPAMLAIVAVISLMLVWRNEFVAVLAGIVLVALLRAAGF